MSGWGFVSTGSLPPPAFIRERLAEAFELARANRSGEVSAVYPALARARRDCLGLCVAPVSGGLHSFGDCGEEFPIMSVSKPFVFARVCDVTGVEAAIEAVGANPTGRPFNDPAAITAGSGGRTNPMVNPGALVVTSHAPGRTFEERWEFLREALSEFAGRALEMDQETLECARTSNFTNRELAAMLEERGLLAISADETLELYTRQCCLKATVRDLALMAATLADEGVHPSTRRRVAGWDSCHATLAVMAAAGLYELSGSWLCEVGLPGKSGISGGILACAPGKAGLAAFAPPLDAAGNSARGWLALRHLSRSMGLSLFLSREAGRDG
ncbi:MAG: glutaminase A [Terrimicrobiaceae bacterium]|nr:glutaminase A [Terrimicrobiaceae bacterium]